MSNQPSTDASDAFYIDQALKLAKRALGRTNPNPMVGAVIVKNGRIIGQGYHRRAGAEHAEIEALREAVNPQGATIYVNLEPCSHYGKTPPCADAIIQAGIRRVVCSTSDPNVKVSGRGLAKLRQVGIDVQVGLREVEARRLNEAFFTFHELGRPFVAVKFAASLDGKLATYTHDSQWITNEAARVFARRLRAQYQAILVGSGTLRHDNPHLGSRQANRPDPIRIVLDSRLSVPLDAQVLRDENIIIATTSHAAAATRWTLEQKGVTVLTFDGNEAPLPALLAALKERNIISVLVEGGGQVIGSFIDTNLIDKVYAFYAPMLVGGAEAVSIDGQGARTIGDALRLEDTTMRRFQDNFLISGYRKA